MKRASISSLHACVRGTASLVFAAFVITMTTPLALADHHEGGTAEQSEDDKDHGNKDHGNKEHGGGHHDPGHANAQAGIMDPGEFRTDLAIYTVVVFFLLLAILGKLAWPKINDALVEREKHIEGQIAAAEAKHEEAKRMLAEHEAKIASTAEEVRGMLEEARRDAEATKEQIVAEARAAAEQEQQRGIREIEIAADHAMKNMAEHSANLAIQMASKVIRQNISPDMQATLIRESLAQLSSNN